MSVFPVVTFILFVIAAVEADGSTEADTAAEAEAKLPKKPFSDRLSYFSFAEYDEVFGSLDVNKDNAINAEDLKSFYYHADSEFAIQKFIQLLDKPPDSPGSIEKSELRRFMSKNKVFLHAHGVKALSSLEERQRYYADKILTYVYLVLDVNTIDNLFNAIESSDRKDGMLDIEEIKDMQVNVLKENAETLKLTDQQAKLILREMSGNEKTISKEDFQEYLLGADISFLFRDCRIKVTNKGAEYNNGCLIRNLVRYTTTHLTEYMKTLVFNALDGEDEEEVASVVEIQKAFGAQRYRVLRFIRYFRGKDNFNLSYEELRNHINIPAIKTQLEKACIKTDLFERVDCFKWKLWNLFVKNFTPLFTAVPDLDIIFLFEDLDTSNDGTIKPKDDLEDGKHWNHDLALKFMDEVEPVEPASDKAVPKEVAPPKRKESVNFYDFFFFMKQPYMMCSIFECQIVKDNHERLACYSSEMEDMINNMLTNKGVDDFFKFYQTAIIFVDTLNGMQIKEQEITNYLNELGLGDLYVNPVEFMYYVKQQETSHLFVTDDKVSPKKHLEPAMLHKQLLHYLERYMTESDGGLLFSRLDRNYNNLIEKNDIVNFEGFDEGLLESMAVFGNKEHVTPLEFWIFINTKPPGKDEPRKRLLENVCPEVVQELQIKCFANNIKLLK